MTPGYFWNVPLWLTRIAALPWECRHWANKSSARTTKWLLLLLFFSILHFNAYCCSVRRTLHTPIILQYGNITHLLLGFLSAVLFSVTTWPKPDYQPQRNASDQLTYYTQCNYFSRVFPRISPGDTPWHAADPLTCLSITIEESTMYMRSCRHLTELRNSPRLVNLGRAVCPCWLFLSSQQHHML